MDPISSIVEVGTREATKTCNRCLETKPRSAFYAMSSAKDGLQSCCIECRKAYNRANADAIRERHRNYMIRTNRISEAGRRRSKPVRRTVPLGDVVEPAVLNRYRLTAGQHETLLVAQGFRCAICFGVPADRRLAIDHDHATGEVRGLLCHRCNLAIGLLDDEPSRLGAAIAYLDASALRAWMAADAAIVGGR